MDVPLKCVQTCSLRFTGCALRCQKPIENLGDVSQTRATCSRNSKLGCIPNFGSDLLAVASVGQLQLQMLLAPFHPCQSCREHHDSPSSKPKQCTTRNQSENCFGHSTAKRPNEWKGSNWLASHPLYLHSLHFGGCMAGWIGTSKTRPN